MNGQVTNVLKDAFSDGRWGNIQVALIHKSLNEGVNSVNNERVPIPPDLDFHQAAKLVMRPVNLPAEQLNGRLDIQRSPTTRFTVRFPYEGL